MDLGGELRHGAAAVGDHDLGHAIEHVEDPLDEEGDGAGVDRRGREVVTVLPLPGRQQNREPGRTADGSRG